MAQQSYQKPLLTYTSSLSSDLISTELDNQSEVSIADIVVKLSGQAEKIFLLVKAAENLPLGPSQKIIDFLVRNENKVHAIVVSGHHEFTSKTVQPLLEKVIWEKEEEKIKSLIQAFAGNR